MSVRSAPARSGGGGDGDGGGRSLSDGGSHLSRSLTIRSTSSAAVTAAAAVVSVVRDVTNCGCGEDDVAWIAPWRTAQACRGGGLALLHSMREIFSNIEQARQASTHARHLSRGGDGGSGAGSRSTSRHLSPHTRSVRESPQPSTLDSAEATLLDYVLPSLATSQRTSRLWLSEATATATAAAAAAAAASAAAASGESLSSAAPVERVSGRPLSTSTSHESGHSSEPQRDSRPASHVICIAECAQSTDTAAAPSPPTVPAIPHFDLLRLEHESLLRRQQQQQQQQHPHPRSEAAQRQRRAAAAAVVDSDLDGSSEANDDSLGGRRVVGGAGEQTARPGGCGPTHRMNESATDSAPGDEEEEEEESSVGGDGHLACVPGDTLHLRYTLLKVLGVGSSSRVWLALDAEQSGLVCQRPQHAPPRPLFVAVKVFRSDAVYADCATYELKLSSFVKESVQQRRHALCDDSSSSSSSSDTTAATAADACDARLTFFHDSFTVTGATGTHRCLVMDVLGAGVDRVIDEAELNGFPAAITRAILRSCLQAVAVLAACSLIHTDLKPENLACVDLEPDVAAEMQAHQTNALSRTPRRTGRLWRRDAHERERLHCYTHRTRAAAVATASDAGGAAGRQRPAYEVRVLDLGLSYLVPPCLRLGVRALARYAAAIGATCDELVAEDPVKQMRWLYTQQQQQQQTQQIRSPRLSLPAGASVGMTEERITEEELCALERQERRRLDSKDNSGGSGGGGHDDDDCRVAAAADALDVDSDRDASSGSDDDECGMFISVRDVSGAAVASLDQQQQQQQRRGRHRASPPPRWCVGASPTSVGPPGGSAVLDSAASTPLPPPPVTLGTASYHSLSAGVAAAAVSSLCSVDGVSSAPHDPLCIADVPSAPTHLPASTVAAAGDTEASASVARLLLEVDVLRHQQYCRGAVVQTREYRAPEVLLGNFYLLSCDVWSIGCIAYELVTGRFLIDAVGDRDAALAAASPSHQHDDTDPLPPPACVYLCDVEQDLDVLQLKAMVRLLGPPPASLLAREPVGLFTRDFFTADGRLRFGGSEEEDAAAAAAHHGGGTAAPPPTAGWAAVQALLREKLGSVEEAAAFEALLLRCLRWDPEERATAAELLADDWLVQHGRHAVATAIVSDVEETDDDHGTA